MPDSDSRPLLRVRNLDVALASRPILSDISFDIEPGSIVGLSGHSGCGKTTLALALLSLLPSEQYRVRGSIQFGGREILNASARELRQVRGAGIALVLQDPLLALNPVLRAGDQIAEAVRAHPKASVRPIRQRVEEVLRVVGLESSRRVCNAYPHQLSGGERQRVVLAQALVCEPRLVIADEPFSALDAPSALALSSLFRDLRERLSTSFLLISHSPGILAAASGRLLAMNGGRIVESVPSDTRQANSLVLEEPATVALRRLAGPPHVRISAVSKSYRARRWWGGEGAARPVLRGIDIELDRGHTLALVGPSGSGKTTLARCLARFETPDSGEIRLDGCKLAATPRGRVQLIFQQPAASLSSRFTAADIVSEPLVISEWGTKRERRVKSLQLMETVGVSPKEADKPAHEFSGGERQRLAIARALALEPELLILDESFSGLDVSLQAQIVNLLLELQSVRRLTYIFISHDLALAARVAHEIAVMDNGTLVERGPAAAVLANPQHAVTRELAEAARLLSV